MMLRFIAIGIFIVISVAAGIIEVINPSTATAIILLVAGLLLVGGFFRPSAYPTNFHQLLSLARTLVRLAEECEGKLPKWTKTAISGIITRTITRWRSVQIDESSSGTSLPTMPSQNSSENLAALRPGTVNGQDDAGTEGPSQPTQAYLGAQEPLQMV